jgi:hypothetical protein
MSAAAGQIGADRVHFIAFYTTTDSPCESEIDTLQTITLGEMATLDEAQRSL